MASSTTWPLASKVPWSSPMVRASQPKQAFEEYGWTSVAAAHKPMNLSVAVVNESPRYELATGIDYDLHLIPIRLAAQALDPDAYLISCSVMKNHNMVVATLSIKNVVVGMTLSPPPGQRLPRSENDKRKYHVGIRQGNYNLYVATKRMMGNWGVGIIDGYEGMEGNGPWSGTPVAHRIAVASTDFLAADRVGVECMGIDAGWPGYLNYCYQDGLGQWDLSKIDVVGAKIADVRIKYRAARRHGSHVAVARPHAGPASEPGPAAAAAGGGSLAVRLRARFSLGGCPSPSTSSELLTGLPRLIQ